MTVKDVCDAIESLAPAGWAYGWDKSGLRIGDPGCEVGRVLVALTVTRAAFERTQAVGAQLIVSHHPPVWLPLDVLRTDNPETRLWIDIAASGIACFAAHTNLDVAPGGVNSVLAERLELTNCKPLLAVPQAAQVKLVTFVPESHLAAVRQAVCEAGAGVIGHYSFCTFSAPGLGTFRPNESTEPFSGEQGRLNEEPERRFEVIVAKARLARVLEALCGAHPYEEVAYDIVPLDNSDTSVGLGIRGEIPEPLELEAFARRVRESLELDYIRYAGDPRRVLRTVGVLGGAGAGEAAKLPSDIDALVTGDVRYHDAVDAVARGIALIDAGHEGTEKFIVPALAQYLKRQFPDLEVFSHSEPDVLRLAQ